MSRPSALQGHRLVIIGGGIAGIDLATHLAGRATARGPLHVTLIDREIAHVWKPMLHTIAAGTQDVYQQQTPYLAQAREHGFIYQPGEMSCLDRATRTIRLAPLKDPRDHDLLAAREIFYDTLILAFGSQANDFGTSGVAEHCYRIDSRTEAMSFNEDARNGILRAVANDKLFRVGIVGGGATGVELAAELVQLAEAAESYGATGAAGRVKVMILESSERILAAFSEKISTLAKARLEQLGVIVHTRMRVAAAEAGGFRLEDGSLVEADLRVWAAGVKASSRTATFDGLERTTSGQFLIGPTLGVTRDSNVYAVGDCSSLTMPGQNRSLPPTAQVAAQQARYLGRWLPTLLAGRKVPAFRYHDLGSLVSLGDYDAFGSLGKFGLFNGGFIRGRLAQIGHALLYRSHQARLHGFWRGSLLWLVDVINSRVHPSIRLD